MSSSRWQSPSLSAAEAARRLGVKPATLYTYVSRGWLHSMPGPSGRTRCYLADEVEALRARAESTRGHSAVAAAAIRWGQPVIDTAISCITPRGPCYRGTLATDLVPRGFPAAAALLIDLPPAPWLPAHRADGVALAIRAAAPPGRGLHQRLVGLMAAAGPEDPRQALQLIAVACARSPEAARSAAQHADPADILAEGLGTTDRRALGAALILCADHELNASTFAARVAASTGATAAMSLCAALAALSGPRHGALSQEVEDLLDRIGAPADVPARLGAGVPPGCGHRLYPDGDPRAQALLALAAPDPLVAALIDEVDARGLPAPSLDLGLVGLCRALGLPRGSAMAVFAAGRAAGWLAHVAEEHRRAVLIRPRARYTGPHVTQKRAWRDP